MLIARVAFLLGCLAVPASAQTLQCTTSGVVQRIPPTPFIPGCRTTPEVFYFSIRGTISAPPGANEEIRLLVRPYDLDGNTIQGCEWVTQCQRAFVLPDNSFVVIGQFGTNNVQRSWFSGQRADVMFALVDINANVPVCISDPNAVSVAVSNVTQIQLDPTLPTFYDYALPCTTTSLGTGGVPTPANTINFALPSAGSIVFGVADTTGLPINNCRAYFSVLVPLIVVPTDATGLLALSLPADPTLAGRDIATQGALIVNGALDLTQPTLVSIR